MYIAWIERYNVLEYIANAHMMHTTSRQPFLVATVINSGWQPSVLATYIGISLNSAGTLTN